MPAALIGPIETFVNSINSPQTRRQYKRKIEIFLDSLELEAGSATTLEEKAVFFIQRATNDPSWAIACVERVVAQQKQRYYAKEISAGTIRNYYKPIKSFCEANDVELKWRRITRGLPKFRQFAQDRAPEDDEIRRLTEYPDRRIKPIVYLMCASGIRVGAWDFLKWGHILPIFDKQNGAMGTLLAAKMTVYAGEPEQYQTFVTPEAYNALKKWMVFREEHGEQIGPHSWVMRDIFKTATLCVGVNYGQSSTPNKLKSSGIRGMLKRAWVSQGLLKESSGGEFDFKSSHGFRKRFKTKCELAGMKPLNVEVLLGHDTGIAGSAYYRPSEQDLLQDYLKAVPSLQVSAVLQAKHEMVEQQQKYQIDIQGVQHQIADLRAQLSTLIYQAQLAGQRTARPNSLG